MSYAEFKEWFDAQNLPAGSTWCAIAEMTDDSVYEAHGLYTYGFAIMAKPEALIQLSEMDKVCYIYTTPLQ